MTVSREVSLDSLELNRTESHTVACGISITGDLGEDVLRDAAQRESVASVLLIQPLSGLGANAFRSAGDVAAFVTNSKRIIREFVKREGASKLLLYYFGPLSGACFLGQELNAICSTIVVMEDQQPGYSEAFHLEY